MISVCIPIFNCDVNSLVKELSLQFKSFNIPGEIILIDDCSDENYKKLNRFKGDNISYYELKENIGRAKIRNLFLKYAGYDYLLFLDCDSVINKDDYLSEYLKIIGINPDVVCGGSIYEKIPPPREKLLWWKYGTFRESQTAEMRNIFPNKSFKTNNFLINKSIFKKISFDERLTDYGHEDTLFGHALNKNGITIIHINNPVVNGNPETNIAFLKKTERALINLNKIMHFPDFDNQLMKDIKILRVYSKIKHFDIPVRWAFIITKPLINFLLSKGYANLRLFEFYKLGTFLINRK